MLQKDNRGSNRLYIACDSALDLIIKFLLIIYWEKNITMNVLTIFVVLVILTTGYVHCREGEMSEKKINVRVENDLKVDTVLILHCRSSNNDLGEKTLHSGQFVEWVFNANHNNITVYSCEIKWNNKQQSFTVYDSTKDEATCTSKCYRSISAQGIYFFYEFKNIWQKRYPLN